MPNTDTDVNKIQDSIKASKVKPIFITILETLSSIRCSKYADARSAGFSLPNFSSKIDVEKNIQFLLSQISSAGTTNYYPRNSVLDSTYPDDIDDSCSSLHVIGLYSPELIHPELISRIIIALDKVRNPQNSFIFNTWFSNEPNFNSEDIVAQSSVIAFFNQINFECTDLNEYVLDKFITKASDYIKMHDKKSLQGSKAPIAPPTVHFSEFYHSPFLPIYLLSRIKLSDDKSSIFIKTLLELIDRDEDLHTSTNDKIIQNPDLFLLVSTLNYLLYLNEDLLNLGLKMEHIDQIHAILQKYSDLKIDDTSSTDISNHKLYIEKIEGNATTYAMSETFSSTVHSEAILGSKYNLSKISSLSNLSENSKQEIHTQTTEQISDLAVSTILQNQIKNLTKYLSKNNNEYISNTLHSLLASSDYKIVKDIYYTKKHSPIDCNILTTHLSGLLGYYLYDKLIDEEIDIIFLPLSNMCIRNFLGGISMYIPDNQNQTIKSVLSETDIAYLFDVQKIQHNNEEIFKKSIGIVIIPLLFYPNQSDHLIEFFKYYQTTRQICDDAKDMTKDSSSSKTTSLSNFRNIKGEISPDAVYKYSKNLCLKAIESASNISNKTEKNDPTNIHKTDDQARDDEQQLSKTLEFHATTLYRKIDKNHFEYKVLCEIKKSLFNTHLKTKMASIETVPLLE